MDPVAQQNYSFFRALYVWHKPASHKNVLITNFHLFIQMLQDGSTLIRLWKLSEMCICQ